MTDKRQAGVYVIRIKGHLSQTWSSLFEPMQLTLTEEGDSILTGVITDQAALHALLRKIRDMNLELQSINRIEEGQ